MKDSGEKKPSSASVNATGQKTLLEILDEIEAREKKATPGPWCWDDRGDKCSDIQIGVALDKNDQPLSGNIENHRVEEVIYVEKIAAEVPSNANATFIAASRTDVPKLVIIAKMYIKELAFHGRQKKLAEITAILAESDKASGEKEA